jgi:hypothetical protein
LVVVEKLVVVAISCRRVPVMIGGQLCNVL